MYEEYSEPQDPAIAKREAVIARVGKELLAARSPRHRELADAIYRRLRDGAEVDDVKHLIEDLSRTAVEDTRRRFPSRRGGSR